MIEGNTNSLFQKSLLFVLLALISLVLSNLVFRFLWTWLCLLTSTFYSFYANPIEPGTKGGDVISDKILEVLLQHNFAAKKSQIYYWSLSFRLFSLFLLSLSLSPSEQQFSLPGLLLRKINTETIRDIPIRKCTSFPQFKELHQTFNQQALWRRVFSVSAFYLTTVCNDSKLQNFCSIEFGIESRWKSRNWELFWLLLHFLCLSEPSMEEVSIFFAHLLKAYCSWMLRTHTWSRGEARSPRNPDCSVRKANRRV